MKTIEGKLIAQGVKVGIVAARFNEFITSRLLSGAMDGLSRHGVKEDEVDLAWVPGAFEIPLAASKMAKSGKYDAVLCLGAVIRGVRDTMTMCAARCQKESPPFRFRAAFLSCSAYSPRKI